MRRSITILAALGLAMAMAGPAAAAPGSSGDHAVRYYLSLGDSLAAGQQPIGDPDDMHRTADGYADQLFAMAKGSVRDLRHVKLGCPGETTVTFREGGICDYRHGSQLDEALSFLRAHRQFMAFITIDLGWNDFPCETGLDCIPPGVASIQANLPPLLAALREAAGPDTPIVGATMYDPFLGAWLLGPEGQAFATMSVDRAIVPINNLVEGIYASMGMLVADVEGAFSTTAFTPLVPLPGMGDVPLNVARICAWTWVCAPAPYGPNNHANHDGYHAMAGAFAAVLGF
jgi:lysophospholipase L1-like esterase